MEAAGYAWLCRLCSFAPDWSFHVHKQAVTVRQISVKTGRPCQSAEIVSWYIRSPLVWQYKQRLKCWTNEPRYTYASQLWWRNWMRWMTTRSARSRGNATKNTRTCWDSELLRKGPEWWGPCQCWQLRRAKAHHLRPKQPSPVLVRKCGHSQPGGTKYAPTDCTPTPQACLAHFFSLQLLR